MLKLIVNKFGDNLHLRLQGGALLLGRLVALHQSSELVKESSKSINFECYRMRPAPWLDAPDLAEISPAPTISRRRHGFAVLRKLTSCQRCLWLNPGQLIPSKSEGSPYSDDPSSLTHSLPHQLVSPHGPAPFGRKQTVFGAFFKDLAANAVGGQVSCAWTNEWRVWRSKEPRRPPFWGTVFLG